MRRPKFNIPMEEFEITPAAKPSKSAAEEAVEEKTVEEKVVEKSDVSKRAVEKQPDGNVQHSDSEKAQHRVVMNRKMYMPEGMPDMRTNRVKGSVKPKRLMSFTQEIYDYTEYESRRRGLTVTQFINNVIYEYMNSPEGHCE